MSKEKEIVIFWYRRDLRLDDNVGLYEALKSGFPVLPIFIFDPEILDGLPKDDARVSFIFYKIQQIRTFLQEKFDSSIAVYHEKPISVFKRLTEEFTVKHVFNNRDYEPYAKQRDRKVQEFLASKNIGFNTFKDQVVFEKDEITKEDGTPYLVYTPYMKKWKSKFKDHKWEVLKAKNYVQNTLKNKHLPNLTLKEIGFKKSTIHVPDYDISPKKIQEYQKTRNIPGIDGTSFLSTHLRFGTIGLRKILKKALAAENNTFLNELIWREFFMQILYHFPETATQSFKKKYDRIEWRNNKEEFEKWKQGETGYPMVDAGMRQLNQTGLMHNRVRMVTASFLCKHLLIDWRWGEAYFAEKLLDYEMSSNVGNWQWAAGSGVDAVPYFRIFNPTAQLEKFDPDQRYVKKWVREIGTEAYPEKMVDHKKARERCLRVFKSALG